MANVDLEAGQLHARERIFSLDFSFVMSGLWPILFAGLILRLLLADLPGFGYDLGSFEAWAGRLASEGPWNFYSPELFADYAPGYLYVLWLFGELNERLHFSPGEYEYLLKTPSILADLGSAYLLYRFLDGQREVVRLIAAATYALFPAALLVGAVWGQVDSLSAFFVLLSIYYISRKRPIHGAAAYVVGFVIKPQIIAALPFLAFWIMKENPPRWLPASSDAWTRAIGWVLLAGGAAGALAAYMIDASATRVQVAGGLVALAGGVLVFATTFFRQAAAALDETPEESPGPGRLPVPPRIWTYAALGGFVTLLLLIFPFFPDYPWDFVGQLKRATEIENYQVTSFWAYNLWGFVGMFESDTKDFLFLSYRNWGLLLFALSVGAVIYSLKDSHEDWALALGTALCLLAFYVFLTRMHERYLFPVFLPLLAACVLRQHPVLWAGFILLSVMHFINLYHVYMYYYPNELRWDTLYRWFEDPSFLGMSIQTKRVLSIPVWVSLPILLATAWALATRVRRRFLGPPGEGPFPSA